MLAGHFATALVANQKYPKGTLLFFLVVSQLQDLLWFTFHYLGLERTGPNDAFDATLQNLEANMLFSHDLLPQFIWAALTFVVGRLLFKSNGIALVGAALMFGHFVLDLLSGFPHHIHGHESHNIALGLYASNPYVAIAIEIVFTIIVMVYFFKTEATKGVVRTAGNRAWIVGIFVFGNVFMLGIATTSLRQLFGIPAFDPGFNTNVPTLIITYVGMILLLNYLVPKHKVMQPAHGA